MKETSSTATPFGGAPDQGQHREPDAEHTTTPERQRPLSILIQQAFFRGRLRKQGGTQRKLVLVGEAPGFFGGRSEGARKFEILDEPGLKLRGPGCSAQRQPLRTCRFLVQPESRLGARLSRRERWIRVERARPPVQRQSSAVVAAKREVPRILQLVCEPEVGIRSPRPACGRARKTPLEAVEGRERAAELLGGRHRRSEPRR